MMISKKAIELEKKWGAHNYHPLPIVLSRGQGPFLYSPEGKRYFDFLAGYGAVNQGHCHPRIVKTFIEQAQKLTLTSRAFYNDRLGEAEAFLCETLGYQKCLFMNSGAEANETALKITRKWAYEVKKVPKGKAKIIALTQNFHGRTLGVISASTDHDSRGGFGPFLEGFEIIERWNLEELADSLEDPTVAGFWFEPIQGEAGVEIPPEGYLKKAAELCRKKNVLLLADEIQTGLCRTGFLTACEFEGVRPDVLILGKSLSGGMMPISAVFADDTIMEVLKPGQHGSTYGGNPLAAATSIEAVRVLLEEDCGPRAIRQGAIFRKTLENTLQGLSHIQEIRGRGLMNAVEITENSKTRAWDYCIRLAEKGILAKPTHETVIRLTPPLILTDAQLTESLGVLCEVLSSV